MEIVPTQDSRNDDSKRELLIILATSEVFFDSTRLNLNPVEFRMLYLLAESQNQILSQVFIQRRELMPDTIEAADVTRMIIRRIRRKLGDTNPDQPIIETINGVNYRLNGAGVNLTIHD